MKPYALHLGDCIEVMRTLADNSMDSIVCDPPYGLSTEPDMAEVLRHWLAGDDYQHKGSGFMGKSWDSFVPGPSVWREALRVLKPGGHLLAFFGSRTYDIGTLAIRLAGFEVRDQAMWLYGSGFPKSLDVSKAIDKAAGAERPILGTAADFARDGAARKTDGSHAEPHSEQGGHGYGDRWSAPVTTAATDAARQWSGWGTALKPAHEPVCVARKPLIGTVAANVLQFGTGALNIDGCRVDATDNTTKAWRGAGDRDREQYRTGTSGKPIPTDAGRWPANLIHDGSAEVVALFPDAKGQQGAITGDEPSAKTKNAFGEFDRRTASEPRREEDKSAARFFYCAKASRADRNEGVGGEPQPFVQFQTGNGASGKPSSLSDGRDTRHSNTHPTVKPTDLMAYLCRLVTPPGGLVLDPFMGSGSTGKACMREGFRFVGIDMTPEYVEIARARIEYELARLEAAEAEAQAAADLAARQADLFATQSNPEAA